MFADETFNTQCDVTTVETIHATEASGPSIQQSETLLLHCDWLECIVVYVWSSFFIRGIRVFCVAAE